MMGTVTVEQIEAGMAEQLTAAALAARLGVSREEVIKSISTKGLRHRWRVTVKLWNICERCGATCNAPKKLCVECAEIRSKEAKERHRKKNKRVSDDERAVVLDMRDAKERKCLRCGKLFDSIGRYNRRCPECEEVVGRSIPVLEAFGRVSMGDHGRG